MRRAHHRAAFAIAALAWGSACATGRAPHAIANATAREDGVASAADAALELVESAPVETGLDHPDVRDAWQVWPEMIARAQARLDFAEFYASDQAPSRLTPIIEAIEAAAERGVRVRFLAEEKFYKTYPETLDRLARRRGVAVRRFDVQKLTGGVLHAKYFVVDGREAFLGSQNFDWRSLEHIQELGLRIRVAEPVRELEDIFETDWALAGGAARSFRTAPPPGGYQFPAAVARGDSAEVTLVASPRGLLPDEALWELPALVELLDKARRTVRVQLLTYKPDFPELEAALLRAASRGVQVQLLVSSWVKPSKLTGLRALLPAVQVRIETIPPWSGGAIPFARVVHAKYLVVDGERAWVGTSNWERDYFYKSRNVGVIIEGGALPARLDRFFLDGWEIADALLRNALDPSPPGR